MQPYEVWKYTIHFLVFAFSPPSWDCKAFTHAFNDKVNYGNQRKNFSYDEWMQEKVDFSLGFNYSTKKAFKVFLLLWKFFRSFSWYVWEKNFWVVRKFNKQKLIEQWSTLQYTLLIIEILICFQLVVIQ